MKTCTACEEQFDEKFTFCPVDGTPLNLLAAELAGFKFLDATSRNGGKLSLLHENAAKRSYEYQPTMLNSAGLLKRLTAELRFLGDRLRTAWPELKRDPRTFAKHAAVDIANLLKLRYGTSGALSALTALFLVFSVVFFVLREGAAAEAKPSGNTDDKSAVELLTLASPSQIISDTGVGTGSKGRVGFDDGKGEGSKPKPKRAHGGGTGGLNDALIAQKGGIPHSSKIPAPIPKLPPTLAPALPDAGIDIDPALWQHLPFPVYGEPRSKSTTPSNGPGDGGGMGDGNGTGIGNGKGDGFGPGSDGNMGGDRRQIGGGGRSGGSGNDPYDSERVFPPSQVAQRARVLAKPEPQYTEEARKNLITGTVVLRVVFSRSGDVTNIRAVRSLPFGLTERAIAAARHIRFSPATKGGRPVSVYMQLEYNFNLY